MTMLEDEEWGGWSNNEIARRVGVSPTTVGTYRDSLSKLDSEDDARTKHGTVSTMNTAKAACVVNQRPRLLIVTGAAGSSGSSTRTASFSFSMASATLSQARSSA